MNSRFQSSGVGYSNPNFRNIVRAYEINAATINENESIQMAVEFVLKNDGPQFLEVIIDEKAKALPKLSVNRPVEDQEPLLPRKELKENMIIEMFQEESK
jgi:acetolactate synthase-1/2/3 large subunit